MSGLLGKLFGAGAGGKGGGKGPSPQEAIQRLRDTEEMLSKKQEFLEKKIEQELAAARKHGTKNNPPVLRVWHLLLILFNCASSFPARAWDRPGGMALH
uniref:Charged multivesicular body protein 4B n=1 Tax=Anser brachyrhynchus TaxID=132585 RepID=A0A8B9I6B4_9AVES